jgi:hypothetical protein
MATFLKIVSGVYLVLVWLAFAGTFAGYHGPESLGNNATHILAFFIAVGLSIPAAILFGFAQVVGDVRVMRNCAVRQVNHLAAMRRYYEPTGDVGAVE